MSADTSSGMAKAYVVKKSGKRIKVRGNMVSSSLSKKKKKLWNFFKNSKGYAGSARAINPSGWSNPCEQVRPVDIGLPSKCRARWADGLTCRTDLFNIWISLELEDDPHE